MFLLLILGFRQEWQMGGPRWYGELTKHLYIYTRLAAVNVTDVAIQVDIWRSLNGRFQQRLVDPRVDLLEADWSPWRPTPWLMPLLVQLSPWRDELLKMEKDLFDQEGHNASVLFVADFPGDYKIT